MLPNDSPTPPKYTNQILYLLSYSGIFLIRQRLSLKVEMSVYMWLLMKPTVGDLFYMKIDQIWRQFEILKHLYVLRVSHCISIRKGEMQNYYTLN